MWNCAGAVAKICCAIATKESASPCDTTWQGMWADSAGATGPHELWSHIKPGTRIKVGCVMVLQRVVIEKDYPSFFISKALTWAGLALPLLAFIASLVSTTALALIWLKRS